jgi:hypothetical protein
MAAALAARREDLDALGCDVRTFDTDEAVCDAAADRIAAG